MEELSKTEVAMTAAIDGARNEREKALNEQPPRLLPWRR